MKNPNFIPFLRKLNLNVKRTKFHLLIVSIFVFTLNSLAQTNFGNYNYIYEEIYQIEATESNYLNIIDKNKIKNITYFDGLGRKIQTRGIKQSPLEKDIVSHYSYDAFGRQTKEFMPFTSLNNNGVFEIGAEPKIITYYNTTKYENTTNPFSENQYDNSPLNRITKQAAPGYSWRMGGGHETKIEYQTNIASEVKYFKVNLSSDFTPTLTGGSWYLPGQLSKTITKDENWKSSDGLNHTIEEFKDKKGNLVLKRTFNNDEKHDTYYVYDIYGNLTFVLSPKVDVHVSSLIVINSKLNDLCYINKYDDKNRLVEKKDPGKGWVYIVYDKLDRPILTQDAVQRAKPTKEWLFTKFDKFGRVTYTGLYKNNGTRVNVQNSASNHTVQFESKGTIFNNYTNNAFPTSISSGDIYTVNYYDDYNFDKDGLSIPSTVYGTTIATKVKNLATGSKIKILETSHWTTTVLGYDDKERAIYTASKNQLLNTTNLISSKLDFVGKVLETKTIHKKTGKTDVVIFDVYSYDHVGRLLTQKQCVGDHTLSSCGDTSTNLIFSETMTLTGNIKHTASNSIILDKGFSVIPTAGQSVEFSVQNDSSTGELIVENHYDELGQLERKKVGNNESTPLQTVDYKYNIRGWLKNINQDTSSDNDLFNFSLKYDDVSDVSKKLYNGNISQTSWNTLSQNTSTKTYTFSYDDLNRITGASGTNTSNYNVSNIDYDKNGNIKTLDRNGWQGTTVYANMDKLVYTYNSGNQLTKVLDNGNDYYGFKDEANITTEYTYDANGNMITNKNKPQIESISYNHLNLPVFVKESGKSIAGILYVYDATGAKIEKRIIEQFGGGASQTTTTAYAGNFTYKNNDLQFFNHSEGYVNNENGTYKYVYQYKDHLGNVRISYTDNDNNGSISQSEIIEENNYYPFGLQQKGYNNVYLPIGNETAQKNKYNGKEYEEALGYNMYEMEMRSYDPAIARWVVQDPVTHHDYSPYSAFDNNPVFYADPSGADSDGSGFGLGRTRTGLGRLGNSGGYTIHFTAESANEAAKESANSNNRNDPGDGCCGIFTKFVNALNNLLSNIGTADDDTLESLKAQVTAESDKFLRVSKAIDATVNGVDVFGIAPLARLSTGLTQEGSLSNYYSSTNNLLGTDYSIGSDSFSTALFFGTIAAGGVGSSYASSARLGNLSVSVYRVYGEGSSIFGKSYTIFNPKYVYNYRNFAGLPKVNSGEFMIKGSVQIKNMQLGRWFAAPIPSSGVTGGLPLEFYVRYKNLTRIKNIPLTKPF